MPAPALYLAVFFFVLAVGAKAQSQLPGGAGAMPAQPAALMDLVAQRNAIEVESLKPWRMVVRVKLGEDQEKRWPAGQEMRIEEVWMSSHRYRVSYQAGDKAWQVFGSDAGPMIVGDGGFAAGLPGQILREFVGPIPNEKARASWILEEKDQTIGTARLRCVTIAGYEIKGEKRPAYGESYCIDADIPDLRVTAEPFRQTQIVRNGLRTFQGQYVSAKVDELRHGVTGTVWSAELESLETVPQLDEKTLIAPPDAKPVVKKIAISAAVAQGNLIRQVRPEYPAGAKAMGIQGTVVLLATIQKNGKLANLHAVSGPEELRQAALDAVKEWQYRPYRLNGEPVEVDTTINVTFNLGR